MKYKTARLMIALTTVSLLPHLAQAQLLITELNSNASEGDFWELTNFGSSPVNLFNGTTPWTWSDDTPSDPTHIVTLPLGLSIGSGESMVILAGGNADAATFMSDWGITSSVQVIGDSGSPGFGKNDAVYLYDDTGATIASFLYSAGDFTLSDGSPSLGGHAGVSAGGTASESAIWDPTSGTTAATARYTFADGSHFGAYTAPTGDGVGSPGSVNAVPEPAAWTLGSLGLAAFALQRRRQGRTI